MVARHVGIRTASPSQEDLEKRREHCSVDPRKLLELGADVGSQVRILTTADDQVLYTISEAPDEDPDSTVRMGLTARRRFGTDDEFDGVIDSQVPHPTLSDTDAEELGEFVERLHDGASATVIAIAPHGGDIELNTDRQAEHVASRLAARGASSWICRGWKSGNRAFESWHITSDETDPGELSVARLGDVAWVRRCRQLPRVQGADRSRRRPRACRAAGGDPRGYRRRHRA